MHGCIGAVALATPSLVGCASDKGHPRQTLRSEPRRAGLHRKYWQCLLSILGTGVSDRIKETRLSVTEPVTCSTVKPGLQHAAPMLEGLFVLALCAADALCLRASPERNRVGGTGPLKETLIGDQASFGLSILPYRGKKDNLNNYQSSGPTFLIAFLSISLKHTSK